MIARAALPFILRSIFGRVGLAPTVQRSGRGRGWRRVIAAFEEWWTASYFAWRSETPAGRHAERFHRFCRDCGRDTPREGFDEFGIGWYAEIYLCRHFGGQGMRIWPL